jgi:serine/threonine protein kinase/lipopolysaccharide biosynthesis regulator YciM
MNQGAKDPTVDRQTESAASNEAAGAVSTCPKCGTKMLASRPADRCPVCQLRDALNPEIESELTLSAGGQAAASPGKQPMALSPNRFDHYQLLARDDGTPIELGHGAMGVTYKAFDTNLRCPVALKVINARYLESESARLRFVREARSAARIRHPNVATVFHLGTKDHNYFYAMEFVEGETLDHLIKRQGPLKVALALEITGQVAAALGAAQKEQIVHRDIKPANIMVSFAEDNCVRVKVIDFGLARAATVSQSDPEVSAPGNFAGTPLFASPEQCAGSEVDIRSDIYSLGVTLWEMLTGKVPFSGTTAEVMSRHLHAPLPLDQLKQVPKPIVILLQYMLEKDPGQRPQDSAALQTALRAVKKALESQFPATSGAIRRGAEFRRRPWWQGKWSLSFLIGAVILASASMVGLHFFGPKSPPSFATAKSIAVLPFDNLSDNKENEYFSDGLTSEVIYELSKLADLRVIARSSILRYKDTPTAHRKPLNEICAELNVGAILDSSVQRVENRVKIVTILYDASTNQQLWSASYDREMKDVFAIQSDLAEQIATALRARLSTNERADIQRKPTGSLTAYDLYLQGRALWQTHRPEDNDKAIGLFKQALEDDPKFVLAYIGLADAYLERVRRFHGEDFWLDSAITLCQEAIALDPKQPRAYIGLASAFNLKGMFDRMDAPVRTALDLAPNDWDANRIAAAEYTEFRREEQMYASIRKCYVTNPYDSWAPYELALICRTVAEKDLAEKWMQRAINLEPDPQRRHLMECERLVHSKDYGEALTAAQQLPLDLKTQYSTTADLVLFCTMQLGDWVAVIQTVNAKLKADSENPTALLRLALALHESGQEVEARRTAEQVVAFAQKKLPTAKSPRWMRFDLAVGFRLLNHYEEAYRYLREMLANGGFPDPVLGPSDPGLNLFKDDSEFQAILADLNRQNDAKRARILEIEKSFNLD